MGKRKSLVIVTVIGSLALVAWLWTTLGTPASMEAESTAPLPPTAEVSGAAELEEPSAPALAVVEPDAPALAVVEHSEERIPEQAAAAAGHGAAIWLAGHVQLPLGTPADERLLVLAVDRPRKLDGLVGNTDLASMAWDPERPRTHALVATAEVEPTGSFRLELPPGTETAHLALSGRYVFSMATTAVRLPAAEGMTLTGELGAWVTGTLLPPADPSPLQSDFEWIKLELGPDITAGIDTARIDSIGVTRETVSTSEGAFEFRGIPGSGAYGISVEHGHLAALLHLGVDPEPGEHLVLELQMIRGATLRGHVVDSAGSGVHGATVEARWRGTLGAAVGGLRKTATDTDGSFELPHVPLGKLDLAASSKGLLEAHLKVETEQAGEGELGGLILVLEGGGTIAGTVAFPDGTPAPDAQVSAGPDLSQLGGMDAMKVVSTRGGSTEADSAGRFELTGLSDSKFELTASLELDDGDHAGLWKATSASVTAEAGEVRLVLEALVHLRGRVTDEQGEPLTAFAVRATLQGSGAMFGIGAKRRNTSYDEADGGTFVMDGFRPATWEVQVLAEGFASSSVEEVTLVEADDTAEVLFTLLPAAAVSGRVVDTGEAPVPGARVTQDLDIAARMQAQQAGGVPEVFTDVNGEFLLEGLDPGAISLVASFEGFAPSEPVPCEIAGGQVTEGLLLRLRTGGTLTGIVYDDTGDPAAGLMVIAQQPPNYAAQKMMSSDGRGEFVFEHLEPGSWQVIATQNFMGEDSTLTEEDADMNDFIGSMKMGVAEIVEGEETSIVLGAPPADPVLLRGRVTHAGSPVAGTVVSLAPDGVQGMDALSSLKMKVTDEDGAFEVRLDQPGAHRVTVQPSAKLGQQTNVEFLEHIPEGVEEHDLEIVLPGGRISGLVRGPDGAPLEGCRVTVNVGSGVVFGSLMGGNYAELSTGPDGRYDAEFLRAGTYTIAVGGVLLGGMFGGQSQGGRVVRGGVVLSEGEALESVDFRLEESAQLSGTVLEPNGAPVAGAAVFVRDDAGHLLERFSLMTTDGAGRFTYPGLAAGRYRVSARKGAQVSGPSPAVSVSPGSSGDVRVTLLPGAVLRIAVVDESGADLQATISVVDSEGHEVAGMLALEDIMGGEGTVFSAKEQRVGPLPDGKYKVTATHADGRTKSRTVRLSGQGERKVKLRLN